MVKPKAVLISDIHYNINTLPIADAALNQAVGKALELEIPLVIAGDLHDTKALLRGECIKAIIQSLATDRIRIIVIPGNHCMLNEKSTEHSLEFLRDRCQIIDSPTHDRRLNVWFIPYQYDSDKLRDTLSNIPAGSTLIMHQGVLGANMGHYIQDKSSLPPETFAAFRVISGHYHRAQDIKCGRPQKGAVGLFSYIGSPYTISFAEANDGPKGFRVLYKDGSLELIPTNLRKHIIMDRDIINALEPVPEYNPGDLVWYKLSGPTVALADCRKEHIGKKLFGHTNFKFDKIPTDSPEMLVQSKYEAPILLDKIIDNTPESPDTKVYLKALWRELLETS